ncbi:hypothetical protein [Solitalea canadensis]|uniref:Uncharacterized protein n=1 Tax=Solitalea canadensis (strain ATCC 29591 / DSM 3403 / JCM 21819 / LMG 8368 / NBRC 15130 / NCIMB 12057 / USAM 9D) TaxID=929556 RepID=H8KMQ4_SOLCM|nr:hypothetical protein [Solitalea canadensis]AFD09045.1 hypothetical protein Solca_4055 [Solitalea canadensis DSM 3403]
MLVIKAKNNKIKQLLSGWLLAVFLITLTPFSAFHHHKSATENATHETKPVKGFVLKASDGSESCLICSFPFVKNFLVENQLHLSYYSVVVRFFAVENVKAQLFINSLKQLRAPPFQSPPF